MTFVSICAPDRKLHEVFAQSADLCSPEGGARGPQTQLLVEHVGGDAQKAAQLIGEEAATAGAVDLQHLVEILQVRGALLAVTMNLAVSEASCAVEADSPSVAL